MMEAVNSRNTGRLLPDKMASHKKHYASCAGEINKILLLHVCLLLNKYSNRLCMVQYYGNCLHVFFLYKVSKINAQWGDMHGCQTCDPSSRWERL